jgi:hypothetical protein
MQLNYTKARDCKIECLGVQEIDVYDIEVEKNHNFFGNGILVHNSIYVNFGPFVDKFAKNKSENEIVDFLLKIQPKIDSVISKAIGGVYDAANGVERTIVYKPEAIASKGFFTAKKRYALKVHNSEGVSYSEPKLKVMGLDLIKTSTPALIRGQLKKALPIIFDSGEKELQVYVESCRKKFNSERIEDISFPRGVSDISKWVDSELGWKSGCPIAVRGAILYNKLTESRRDEYNSISDGDKIRFVYLKLPNPIKQNIISYPASGKFPNINNLAKYIDWDLQFEKVFLSPIIGITKTLDWNAVEVSDLSEFF